MWAAPRGISIRARSNGRTRPTEFTVCRETFIPKADNISEMIHPDDRAIFKFKQKASPIAWLRWLVIISIIPPWIVVGITIAGSYQRERSMLANGTIATARALLQAVERDLASAESALSALATSPYIASGDFAGFYRQSREVLAQQAGNGIVLADAATKQQLMSTIVPYGQDLPRSGLPNLLQVIFDTGKPAISDFYFGATSKAPQVAMGVPIFREGRVVDVPTCVERRRAHRQRR